MAIMFGIRTQFDRRQRWEWSLSCHLSALCHNHLQVCKRYYFVIELYMKKNVFLLKFSVWTCLQDLPQAFIPN